MLPGTELAEAGQIVERQRAEIDAASTIVDGVTIRITGSFRVCYGARTSLDDCIDRADQALYRAKEADRNRIAVYADPPPPSRDDVER